jgi:DNA repair exonuclease SbcCD ATPase subunit
MIRRLRIQGWRAFDDVTLELGEGLTFVVADNGVGKTSLVQAASWGLYGALSQVDAGAARRVGASLTRVDVDVELPDGRTLSIGREARDRGGDIVWTRLGEDELDDDGLAGALSDAFGATREFLSMTTLLPSDAVADDAAGAFHLQTHLRKVFGVEDLQRAAEAVRRLHTEAGAAARQLRQASRQAAADLTRLRATLADAEAERVRADAVRAEARSVLALAEGELRLARDREALRDKATAAKQSFTELVAAAREALGRGARLGRVTRPADLTARLEAAELAATETLDEHRRDAATVAGRLAAVEASATALSAADAQCPVCRRDLTPDDIIHAGEAHAHELEDLLSRQQSLATQVEAAQARLAELRTLARRAARLPDIEASSDTDGAELTGAESAAQVARSEVERLDEQAALARARVVALSTQVEEEARIAQESEQAYQTHRREAVTGIAAEVMQATADAIVTQRIDPLAAEISHRWKRVFGERGSLQLRSDGRLVLVRGIHEIPFSQFSSGEKVVALLATRLLVLGASTRASFLWLDEPLEHLDPRNRRITASLMSSAGQHVRQILVTTYEEALARRLASAASAHLRYVRSPES